MDELGQRLKERDALEGAYGSFVEPYVNQQMGAAWDRAADGVGVCSVLAWLVLTGVYCAKVRSHFSNVTR